MRGASVLGMVASVCLTGCAANVEHQQLTDESKATGVRYYDSAPYLLVYSDGKGGLFWQVIYLPDQSHIMVATPQVVGGHTETSMTFTNGVLGSTSTLGDTTAIPKAIITAIQTALPLLAAAAGNAQTGFPAPYLYKLKVVGGNLQFIGGQGKYLKDGTTPTAINLQVPIVTKVAQ